MLAAARARALAAELAPRLDPRVLHYVALVNAEEACEADTVPLVEHDPAEAATLFGERAAGALLVVDVLYEGDTNDPGLPCARCIVGSEGAVVHEETLRVVSREPDIPDAVAGAVHAYVREHLAVVTPPEGGDDTPARGLCYCRVTAACELEFALLPVADVQGAFAGDADNVAALLDMLDSYDPKAYAAVWLQYDLNGSVRTGLLPLHVGERPFTTTSRSDSEAACPTTV